MKVNNIPFEIIGREIGISPRDAQWATCRFLKWLTSNILNYDEGNRDFIGEKLHWILNRSTFYHLLGLFDVFSDRYSWEKGIAKEYLLRIAPRDEWPNYIDESAEIPKPDASKVEASMTQVCSLARDPRFEINLVVCISNARLYARMSVSESIFDDCSKTDIIDYVPLTPADLADLMGLDPHAMLIRIENRSIDQDCIVTRQGKAKWHNRVAYPYT